MYLGRELVTQHLSFQTAQHEGAQNLVHLGHYAVL
jgi:hypothetical protein